MMMSEKVPCRPTFPIVERSLVEHRLKMIDAVGGAMIMMVSPKRLTHITHSTTNLFCPIINICYQQAKPIHAKPKQINAIKIINQTCKEKQAMEFDDVFVQTKFVRFL